MSPDKLRRLRQTIEFIEKMSPTEREAMRIRLSHITQATPKIRKEIDELAKLLPSGLHSPVSQFWLAASEAERNIIRSHIARLDDDEKGPFLEKKVQAFIIHRDEVFKAMKETLESNRNKKLPPPDLSP